MREIKIKTTTTIDIKIGEEVHLKNVSILQNVGSVPFCWQDREFESGDNGFTILPNGTVAFSESQDVYIKPNTSFCQRLQVSNNFSKKTIALTT